MQIGTTEVLYIKNYTGNEVTSVTVEVRIPATDGDVSGYVTLGSINGWILSENKTKLSKEYSTNQTEVITITMVGFNGTTFDNATTMKSIEVYDINASKYVRVKVDYAREESNGESNLIYATVTAYIKDAYIGSYSFSTINAEWRISQDKTAMTKEVEVNGSFINECAIFPTGETESDTNRIKETISYRVEYVGLGISAPSVISTEKTFEDVVVGAEVVVTVPYMLGSGTGKAILGEVDGWILSSDKKNLTKAFLENAEETISIPVLEAIGYTYTAYNVDATIKVDTINYKKTVKGICGASRCLYDVYTKYEIENLKLGLENQIEELKALINKEG